MQQTSPAHYAFIHSVEALHVQRGRAAWPWSTAAIAVFVLLAGASALSIFEFAWVAKLPNVQRAASERQALLRQNTLRTQVQTRLGEIDQVLPQIEDALRGLQVKLRDELGLQGPGPKYADFATPPNLDALIVEDDTARDAWESVESALVSEHEMKRLAAAADAFRQPRYYEANDLAAIDELAGKTQVALNQATTALDSARHLVLLLQAQELRGHQPERKEP